MNSLCLQYFNLNKEEGQGVGGNTLQTKVKTAETQNLKASVKGIQILTVTAQIMLYCQVIGYIYVLVIKCIF